MVSEGAEVAYTGLDGGDLCSGDQGRVLSLSGPVAHVFWTTGSCTDQVVPVYDRDLLPLASSDGMTDMLGDSLEVESLPPFSARAVYDSGGEVAVLNEMAETGSLAMFASIAEDALTLVASRIRSDSAFHAVMADLEDDEAEAVLRMASICLIRDAFSVED
jgi:hypothetical protein